MTNLAKAQELFFAALDAQNGKRLDIAERLYREALALAPDRPSVLNNLATVLQQQGRHPESREYCERLLALNPADAGTWMIFGNMQTGLGLPTEALPSYDRALAIAPDHAQTLANRGNALAKLGRHAEALADLHRALQITPHQAEALVNRGNVLMDLNRCDEAIADYQRALADDPGNAGLLGNLGNALAATGRHAAALEHLDRALQIKPDQPEMLINRSSVLTELGRVADAIADCRRALTLQPDHAGFMSRLGNALLRSERPEEAIAACEKAIALDPSCADAFQNRGNALVLLGRHVQALDDYARAQSLAPGSARPCWNEALCRLLLGDFERGWTHYARGWEIGQRGKQRPQFTQPAWNGVYVEGALLAWGEQGIGDQILHSSMLEELRTCARRLIVAIDPRLVPLLQRSYADIRFVSLAELPALGGFDVQVAMGDIGAQLRRNWESFPLHRQGFLTADPGRSQQLRKRLGADGRLLCGISWRSTNAAVGEFKSMALADLAALIALPGVKCIDLQYGDTVNERSALQKNTGFEITHIDDIDNFHDIDALASLIDACDIVVSVSNTTVHLAGALGKPTLVMLPYALGRIWYWHERHENRDRSPWYPACRLFRQTAIGGWRPVIADVVATVAATNTTA
jgi:tetratricopeptide (TPR) repeat protein